MIPGCFIDLALVPMPGLAVLYAMPKALNVIAATTPMMPKKVAFGGRVRQRHVRHVQAGAGSPRCCYCSSRIKGSQPIARSYTTSRIAERPTARSTSAREALRQGLSNWHLNFGSMAAPLTLKRTQTAEAHVALFVERPRTRQS
ncbi:uncharacterized protein LOC119450400 isoform X3 [Dermacentor silvarum]|uniref:uncharacterized protein LOC119450400 isoform X3 n=1 Tax=Dermacentor silvarum TaxID=543639 RepID=UPI0018987B6C|nr:uncharacterized protein LOC119450400 isoform X3 [Dermacentor silvarum]